MNQYLVRHTNLVLASMSKQEGEEFAEDDRDIFDVEIGLAVDALRRRLEVEPQFVNVRVMDSNNELVDKYNMTFCRKDYHENHDALFKYLLSILDFAEWQRVDVAGVLSATNQPYDIKEGWKKLFPTLNKTIETVKYVFKIFFAHEMLKITDPNTQLHDYLDGDPDSLPGVVWTFTMHANAHKAGGGGGGFQSTAERKRNRNEETTPARNKQPQLETTPASF
jgi:hypothetical protein